MDDADGQQLLSEGLGLDIPVQSVLRARSVNHQAGVELTCVGDQQQVNVNKMKLSRTQKCYDVFIGYEPAGLTVHPPPKMIEGGFIFFVWVSSVTKNFS